MIITIEDLGIRFMKRWLFQNLNLQFSSGFSYAIVGANGSGKSTLLQLLIGLFPPTLGNISYSFDKKILDPDQLYKFISVSTPYMELIEEFTLSEQWEFHAKFKKPLLSLNEFIKRTNFVLDQSKPIKYFSSGMKQRLKLGLCFFFQADALFLDEPTSNLDQVNIKWYLDEINLILKQKEHLVVICSNIKEEYSFCDKVISL